MFEQRFISKLIGKDGRMVDFERWGCKRLKTVVDRLARLYFLNGFASLFRKKLDATEYIVIYSSESDGTNEREEKRMTVKELEEVSKTLAC